MQHVARLHGLHSGCALLAKYKRKLAKYISVTESAHLFLFCLDFTKIILTRDLFDDAALPLHQDVATVWLVFLFDNGRVRQETHHLDLGGQLHEILEIVLGHRLEAGEVQQLFDKLVYQGLLSIFRSDGEQGADLSTPLLILRFLARFDGQLTLLFESRLLSVHLLQFNVFAKIYLRNYF